MNSMDLWLNEIKERRAKGLCEDCGERPPVAGSEVCMECIEQRSADAHDAAEEAEMWRT